MEVVGQQRARVEECLVGIAAALESQPLLNSANLMQGALGHALFFAYYYGHTQDEKYLDLCLERLEASLSAASTSDQLSSLGVGFTGVCWVVKHLIDMGWLDPSAQDILEETHPAILQSFAADVQRKEFDLLYGYCGKLVYFDLFDPPLFQLQWKMAAAGLAGSLVHDGHGQARWEDPATGTVNLGLAHGLAGLLLSLARVQQRLPAPGPESLVFEPALAFLQGCRLPGNSWYPAVLKAGEPPQPSRLAWCHGDLGIAFALLQVGQRLGKAAFVQAGLEAAANCAGRAVAEAGLGWDETIGAYDVGWCHGTAGNAYLFRQLSRCAPQLPQLADCYHEWLGLTVASVEKRLAAYRAGHPMRQVRHEDFVWEPEHSLIEGISGTGLVLLAALNPAQCGWDQLFLASLE